MKKWLLGNLLEPTAWLCVILAISILIAPDWFSWFLCAVGFCMDEQKMKTWCEAKAPKLTAWIESL